MEISVTPDIYAPSVDEHGNYVDTIPVIRNGIHCPCSEKIYENASKFRTHTRSKTHQKWITNMNQNKINHYVEMIKNKETVENQQKIIARLEN